MKKATLALGTCVAVVASMLGVFGLAGPAAAKQKCVIVPSSSLVPYLLSPCDGAAVAANGTVTFRVRDANSQASHYPPYLNLATRRVVKHGVLKPIINGDGIFHELKRVKHGDTWTYTSTRESFPTWFDNHKGTYYLQIQQIDSRASTGTYYSPITTVHVG